MNNLPLLIQYNTWIHEFNSNKTKRHPHNIEPRTQNSKGRRKLSSKLCCFFTWQQMCFRPVSQSLRTIKMISVASTTNLSPSVDPTSSIQHSIFFICRTVQYSVINNFILEFLFFKFESKSKEVQIKFPKIQNISNVK